MVRPVLQVNFVNGYSPFIVHFEIQTLLIIPKVLAL